MNFISPFAFCLLSLVFPQQKIVDQILMLVNDEVITRVDLLWSLAMDPNAPNPANGVNADLLRQKLDVMIDERLISQEATRIPTAEVTQEEIKAYKDNLIKKFPTEVAFRARLEAVGLTNEKLDELIRVRITIEKYVAFRFESFVFVTDQEIQEFYDQKFAPRRKAQGQIPPSLNEAREYIRTEIKGDKVISEIETWLTSSRQRAEIISLVEP
jgi:hypothetical protein